MKVEKNECMGCWNDSIPRVFQCSGWGMKVGLIEWGRELALLSSFCLFLFSFANFAHTNDVFYVVIALYSICFALTVWVWLWPLPMCGLFALPVEGPWRGFVVGPLLMFFSLPTLITVPTILWGLGVFFSGLLFLAGAFHRERGRTIRDMLKQWCIYI